MRQPSPRWEAPSTRAISRPTDGFSATTTVLIPPAYHKLPHCARRAAPAVLGASAFGSDSTQTRPTSRGRVCCGAFLAARWCGQTAPGPRAGAGRLLLSERMPLCVPPKTAAGGKSLLVDLPSSARTVAPFGTKRSAQAPCSWGLGASPRRQRLWLPAPPARPYAKFMYIFSLGVDFWQRFAYNYTL